MPQGSEESPEAEKTDWQALDKFGGSLWEMYHSRPFWRSLALLCAVNLGVLLAGGVWIYFIFLGIFMALVRLPAVSAPLRRLMAGMTGNAPEKYLFTPLQGSPWKKAFSLWPSYSGWGLLRWAVGFFSGMGSCIRIRSI